MWRACMIVKYIERSLKYFKALFANIFNQKEKKTLFANARIGRELLRDIRSAIRIEFFVKISPTLLKLDALIALIFAGQKRQLEITTNNMTRKSVY